MELYIKFIQIIGEKENLNISSLKIYKKIGYTKNLEIRYKGVAFYS